MDRALGFRDDGHVLAPGSDDCALSGTAADDAAQIALLETGSRRASGHGIVPSREKLDSGDEPAESAEALAAGLFQDIPRSIWTTFLAGWAGFFLLMWLFFAVDADSTFVVSVAILFGLMAFGLPIVMARQSKCGPCAPCDVVQTHTGPVSVRAAAAQIAMIPIAVFIGLLGFILVAK